ncbi:DNA-binding transcription factor yap1 [Dissophora globulifera]|uniref:DNA-binding transcription factor yap1 n=1 Tax=Dissophora globulifera TaxID=979702 RepID=A0A9P6RS06_9FUNG|nr:DNA-binding transcription factor yap1 [Dissophora globulifera]
MSLQQQSDIYPTLLPDSDWAKLLHSNRAAQDLLPTTIAQHEQYREEDPIKRKGVLGLLHNKSDALDRQSSFGEFADENQHVYSENSSDESHSIGDGKPAPKKAGRKPLTTEPTNKRKAQNRAAQRAFRDRKERYVKSLEERIKELEELNPPKTDTKLVEENLSLKVLVQKLETENYFLKEQAFTFDFPISQPGLYNAAREHSGDMLESTSRNSSSNSQQHTASPSSQTIENNGSNSSVSPSPKTHTDGPASRPPMYDQLPWSPPSSVGDSVPNSPLDHDLSATEQDVTNQPTHLDNAAVVPRFRNSSPEEIALFSSILDRANTNSGDGSLPQWSSAARDSYPAVTSTQVSRLDDLGQDGQSSSASVGSSTPASTLVGFSDHTPSPTLGDLVSAPLFESGTGGNIHFKPSGSSLAMPLLTFEQTQALFTDFRDSSDSRDFFASFEDPAESAFPGNTIGGLFNDQLMDYTSVFANVAATPGREDARDLFSKLEAEDPKRLLPPLGENEKAITCPQVWEQIAKHPNFDDADIDDLCAELKSKAKCSGHGPVIALSDVNELMSRMNQD